MADNETYRLAVLLELVLNELHPTYPNTSRRGRGIGGQACTRQCNLVDPEGYEFGMIQIVEDAVRHYFRAAEAEGVNLAALRDVTMDEAADEWRAMQSGEAR